MGVIARGNATVWFGFLLWMLVAPLAAQRSDSEVLERFEPNTLKSYEIQDSVRRGTDPLALYPEAERWIRDAIEKGLAERGILPAGSGSADFHIRISASTAPKSRKVRSSHLTNTFLEHSLQGTLTLEFSDPSSGKVFWKGWAVDQAPLNEDGVDLKPEKGRKMVERGVQRILRRFFRDARR